jgi:RHS repeat-associated protein
MVLQVRRERTIKTGLCAATAAIRQVTNRVRRLTIHCFALSTIASTGYSETPATTGSGPSSPPTQVNRTLPKFNPPKTTLEFSANPTEEEFFRARVFAEPLAPVGGHPTADENADLAAALLGYARRSGPDDFASLTGFLDKHPHSPWTAALLTDLGLEYYNTAHYSLALDAWGKAWDLTKAPKEISAVAIGNRAVGELACMDARLGRMTELDALLNSLKGRMFHGAALGRITGAKEGLWTMKNRPQVAFRCGPLALYSIQRAFDPQHAGTMEIFNSASTTEGFSLPQVADLSKKIGLNYQMAFREKGGAFVVPSVVHWKVGHYAAVMKQAGDLYFVKDPTFRNSVWASRAALEAETSGYFLIPPGPLPTGWRTVEAGEGASVWGKGMTSGNDPSCTTPADLKTGLIPCAGMMVPAVHLMDVNLILSDQPLGYTPPVGPPVRFTVRYHSRDFSELDGAGSIGATPGNFGFQWTSDYAGYIEDNPSNPLADVTYHVGGGGYRTFTGFNTNTQSFDPQQYDETLLTRTGSNSYQLLSPDGSKMIFFQPDGGIGTSRNVFLRQIVDPQGNALTLTYDSNLLLVAITDAIGQVTTLTYGVPALNEGCLNVPSDPYKITKVTDPFGRSATFDYGPVYIGFFVCIGDGCPTECVAFSDETNETYGYAYFGWELSSVTDVIGLTSQIGYAQFLDILGRDTNLLAVGYNSVFADALTTPYGTTYFFQDNTLDVVTDPTDTTRYVETIYPDGSRDRVEYNQSTSMPMSNAPSSVPTGMATDNNLLSYRTTYYWSRNACASSYGDYTKAKIYHWLHTDDLTTTSGILESTKEPLENRVWFDYAGQDPNIPLVAPSIVVGANNLPTHVGRVLDDGTTQLYTYAYNAFGHLTNSIDPLGRTLSYIYDTNGIDVLEVRQTRAGNNDLLFKATYDSQHRPLTLTDASGQTTTRTYNSRGQILSTTDARNETTTFSYDSNGYLLQFTGPLSVPNDSVTGTYDAFGHVRSLTDGSGYTEIFDYDNLNRLTRATFPDSTFRQLTYDRLDLVTIRDRAGRQTSLEYDSVRHLTKKIDALGRVTLAQWCNCGSLKSLTDPMGRTTTWLTDVEDRRTSKQYSDGSQVDYLYENTTSRLKQVVDEKRQTTFYKYNPDDSTKSIYYGDSAIPTPSVSFTYDPNYLRISSMTDGIGATTYNYQPVMALPALGAGRLARLNGPLTSDIRTYAYDELGRQVQTSIDGVVASRIFDVSGRVTGKSNELGTFAYAYDGSSMRLVSQSGPNGQMAALSYGNNLQDFMLQQITYATRATPVSQFSYGNDVPRMLITNWSQQAGTQSPSVFSFGYDSVNQLLSATVTNSCVAVSNFSYTYDLAGNRLTEFASEMATSSTFNALNQLSTTANPSENVHTNEWDALNRLTAVNAGSNRTEFAYDGMSRLAYIRQLQNGSEISFRRFVWLNGRMSEERDKTGVIVNKRFFPQGVELVTGANAGAYFYTRDHLGSIRELTDAGGNVRARYSYDPYGRKTKVSGDVDADFGFAGMFWSSEASLALTRFRAYDPNLGRWLSRDPFKRAEAKEGPNLYAYVLNDPVNLIDPSGLLWTKWTPDVLAGFKARLTPEQFALIEAQQTGRPPVMPWDPPTPNVPDGGLPDVPGGGTPDVPGGGLADVPGGESPDLPGGEIQEVPEPTFESPVWNPADFVPIYEISWFRVFSAPLTVLVQSEFTVLTMTDCNTANGIVALVRQGKGGLLNAYEDMQMKQLENQ